MKKTAILLALFLALTLVVFAQEKLETTVIKIRETRIIAEIADTNRAQIRGLMYRDEVPDGTGMLFVYKKPVRAEFWMRHTYVPLSVAFINKDGKIVQIERMAEINSAVIYRSKEKIKYALEVPLDFFDKHGITVGDSCSIGISEKNPRGY